MLDGRHAIRRLDVVDRTGVACLTWNYDYLFGRGSGRVGYPSVIFRP